MTTYVPGTDESDHKKQNMSLQQIGPKLDTAISNVATNTASIVTNTANIATNTANIATNTSNIATNTASIATNTTNIASNTSAISALQTLASPIHASLGADVLLNNTANYFDGPSIAQGSTGTWFVSGNVTLQDTAGAGGFFCKLWDGTTVIDSGWVSSAAASFAASMTLSGYLATPAGNLKISCRDTSSTSGKILFNGSGNSKDSTISAYRIA